MESSLGQRLAILDYHTLLRHYSSSSPQHTLSSDPSLRGRHCVFEDRPHASQDDGLRPRGELRVTNASSSTSADELERSGSKYGNNGMLEGSFSEFGVDVVETSRESEAAMALAKERELLVAEVMTSLGPCGAGLLAVRGVPEVPILRKRLLPLAKKLALMSDATRRPVLKNYGLSTDVPLKRPDRPVSAFATKLQYARHAHDTAGACISPPFTQCSPGCLCDVSSTKDLSTKSEESVSCEQSDLAHLGLLVRQLGASMVEVGLLVARLCDSAIPGAHLEAAIWESGSVKGRLIHYHAHSEKDLLAAHCETISNGFSIKGTPRRPSQTKREVEGSRETSSEASVDPTAISEELWQEWHYDYGILTVLTDPMFLSSQPVSPTHCGSEWEGYPGGHTGLRVLSRGVDSFVDVTPDCLLVQVGEAAQIASGGKLAAVAHCVCRMSDRDIDRSRETFVTFLQPAWDRVLSPPMGTTRAEVLDFGTGKKSRTTDVDLKDREKGDLREDGAEPLQGNFCYREGLGSSNKFNERLAELLSVVPSLDSRWKEGCTFAEFSRETTGQYYGAQGRQSKRIVSAKE